MERIEHDAWTIEKIAKNIAQSPSEYESERADIIAAARKIIAAFEGDRLNTYLEQLRARVSSDSELLKAFDRAKIDRSTYYKALREHRDITHPIALRVLDTIRGG